jgi:predicted AlkP superfamily pyrophosphatase or phosphodiesterase
MPNKALEEKLILIVLDGCRYDTAIEQMGVMNHFVEHQQATLIKVIAEMPSNSRPLYEVLGTGVPSYRNGILTNGHVRRSQEISLFDLVKQAGGKTGAAAYYWQSELFNEAPYDITRHRIQHDENKAIQHGIFYSEDGYPDSHVFADANYLIQTYTPNFMLIHSMNIDDIGHKFTADSREYAAAVNHVDTILGMCLPEWLQLGYQILVTADHGMDNKGLHGGSLAAHREVPFFIFSTKFPENSGIRQMNQLEVAPLICNLLGIEASDKMQIGNTRGQQS